MIKSTVAFTKEIDNPEAASAEISAQIKDRIELLQNTVGVVNCHMAFLETGALKAICDALPFPVCGFTTSINGGGPSEVAATGSGELFLTMMVLTSDEIQFSISVSDKITPGGDYEKALSSAFSDETAPALVCVTAPTISLIPGDDLVDTFDKILPGVPLFGGYAVDDSPRYNENVFAIANGESYTDRAVFLKIFGDVKPLFYSASLSRDKIKDQFAVVTESKGTEIITLNNRPVTEFLEATGLSEALLEAGIVTNFALIIEDPETKTYYARAMLHLTPEKTLICGGTIPQGVHLRIGQFDKGDTIASGKSAADLAFMGKARAFIAISSISRATILGSDIFHGIDTVRKAADGAPFVMGYVAGEICAHFVDGKYINRFNNQSFNACVL
jgi:hypothetical protein